MKRFTLAVVSLLLFGGGCQMPFSKEPTARPLVTKSQEKLVEQTELAPVEEKPVEKPAAEPAKTGTIKIFMVALDDNGKSGKVIGCGDSVVPVNVIIPQTTAPLTAAIKELLKVKTQYYGQSGLYNSLFQSNLLVSNVVIVNGVATISLTGTHALGGTCDAPRFEAQLKETALQFPTVKSVEILIDGKKLEDVLSSRG